MTFAIIQFVPGGPVEQVEQVIAKIQGTESILTQKLIRENLT